jgi:hypothetical protein
MIEKNLAVTIRDAGPMDQASLRRAVVELREYQLRFHKTRLLGEQVAVFV